MTNEQSMNLLRTVFGAIFQSKAANTDITQTILITNTGEFTGRWFVNGLLRGFDFTCNLGDRIIGVRCLEQNPNKTDNNGNLKKYANLARQGHQIMWVIDTKSNPNKWLGHMMDNVWHASFQPATTPATPNQYDNAAQRAREDTAYTHIDHDYNNPNFHGIPGTSGTPLENLPVEMAMPHNLPGAQNPAASHDPSMSYVQEDMPIEVDELPEIPNGVTVPDYVYEQIADMDESPDWEEYE